MTLKQFAEQQGLNYRTAQTWLRRGRIQLEDSGFRLVEASESSPRQDSEDSTPAILNPESSECESCQDSEDSKSLALNPESESEIESVAPESCSGCAALQVQIDRLANEIESCAARQSKIESAPSCAEVEAAWTTLERLSAHIERIDTLLRMAGADRDQGNAGRGRAREIDPPGPIWGA